MIKQYVKDYKTTLAFELSESKPNGDSASPKDIIFHILSNNSTPTSILDIGFGAGKLGSLIKDNPQTAHWEVDGIDGWESNCKNTELISKNVYRNIWYGLAQDLPATQFSQYKIICLLDVIEHLNTETAKDLLNSILINLNNDSYLFISTPLWFYPQEQAQDGDLEEHLIGVPASSMFSLIPKMYAINHPLIGGFVLTKQSLDYIDFFQPVANKNFTFEKGIKILNAMNIEYKPGVLFKY